MKNKILPIITIEPERIFIDRGVSYRRIGYCCRCGECCQMGIDNTSETPCSNLKNELGNLSCKEYDSSHRSFNHCCKEFPISPRQISNISTPNCTYVFIRI